MRQAAPIAVPLEPAAVPRPRPPAEAVLCTVAAAGPEPRAEVHEAGALPAGLVEDWTALGACASEPNSYAEAWFLTASMAAFGDEQPLRLVEARRGEVLLGIMALSVEAHYGRLPVRCVQNWCHYHLFLGTPLVRAGEEQTFWTAVLKALDAAGWAPNFLHVSGLVENGPVHRGLALAAAALGRACPTVHRESRAMLEGVTDAEAAYRDAVRPKKRKELRRLQSRLAEQGDVTVRRLGPGEELEPWCDLFLALEAAGWKGREGSALACEARTELFFRSALAGAHAAGRLEFLRLDLDGRPIAMLVDFLAPPGSFSFKTAFDEDYARFSPGVLIQLENMRTLERGDLQWMDSCAVEKHPMIESLWPGRRHLVRVTVPLAGVRRSLAFALCHALAGGSAALRRLRKEKAA